MTNEQCAAKNALYPHLSMETIAYHAGRSSVDFGGKCQFTDATLVEAFNRGRRSAMAEDRLSADREWDADAQD
jgi:hypothetical protein